MSKAFHAITGVIGLSSATPHTGIIIAVLQDMKANNYEIWRIPSSEVDEFTGLVDDWIDSGLAVRGSMIHPDSAVWSKYPDEFVTEPAARKFATRQTGGYIESHGMRPFPIAEDVDMLAVCRAAHVPGLECGVCGLTPPPPPGSEPEAEPPAAGRFGDADEDFASRFARKAAEKAAAAAGAPSPEQVPVLNEEASSFMSRPIRLENPDSAKGGKFWEIEIVYDTRPDKDGVPIAAKWHVDVTFGALVDEAHGRGIQTRNVAHKHTKAAAMSVRSERIAKQRKKGYRQVALGDVR